MTPGGPGRDRARDWTGLDGREPPMNTDTAKRVPGAGSARRTLHILMCFSPDRPVWTVAQLSRELGIPLASTYRHLALLREVGLVGTAADKSRYRLTDRVGALARAARAGHLSLLNVALPVLTRVRDQIDETVLVAARSGDEVFCVERVESRRPVPLQFESGQPMSLHRGALARVLLAAMPGDERADYLRRFSADISADRAAALTPGALDAVRALGYTESFEEIDAGIWGVAAAVVQDRSVLVSLGTAAPVHRADAARRARIVELVVCAAHEIGAALPRSGR